MLHFYYSPHILLQKYLDMLFLWQLLFQRLYFFRSEPFTIIFCPTFSKMSVLRFAISDLQIISSPTPLRWLNYSIFNTNCQKMFVCVIFLYISIYICLAGLFLVFYKYITIILQKYYKCFFVSFPLAPIPLIPSFPSLNSYAISSIVINLYFSVKAIF